MNPPIFRKGKYRMRTSKSIPQQLGAKIARDIFAYGEEQFHVPIKRISLITGEWPHDESPVCGFCEMALADFIAESVARHLGKI